MTERKPFGELEWSDVVPDRSNPKDVLLFELACQLAQQMAEEKKIEESFDVKDRSFVAGKAPVTREPEYFISPFDGAHLRVRVVEIDDPDIPDTKKMVRCWCLIEQYMCPTCEHTNDMFGWVLEEQPGQPNKIVQCPHCGQFHWFVGGCKVGADAGA
jgi:hypothetical protein